MYAETWISLRPVTSTAKDRFYQRARPSVPEQRPPSHMTKPTLSGTFRGSPGQPGTFQPTCLQSRGGAHRLAAVPGPRPKAHEATTRPHYGPGGSRNQPLRLEGGGDSTCAPGVSGSLQKAAQLPVPTPYAPQGLLYPPKPQSLLRLSTPPRKIHKPRASSPDTPGQSELPLLLRRTSACMTQPRGLWVSVLGVWESGRPQKGCGGPRAAPLGRPRCPPDGKCIS